MGQPLCFVYACDNCDYFSETLYDLEQHKGGVDSCKGLQCSQGDNINFTAGSDALKYNKDKVIRGKTYLKAHIDEVHKGIQYSCNQCTNGERGLYKAYTNVQLIMIIGSRFDVINAFICDHVDTLS